MDTLFYICLLAIKSDMKTAQKIVSNLMNENILPLKVSTLRQDGWYLGITNLISKHTFHIQNPFFWTFVMLAHMLNGYEIYLNTTKYLIFNMQDFIYWLCASILDCFGQVVSPLYCSGTRDLDYDTDELA